MSGSISGWLCLHLTILYDNNCARQRWKARIYKGVGMHKRKRIPKGQSKIDNPEKPAPESIQDETIKAITTTRYVLDTTMHKQHK